MKRLLWLTCLCCSSSLMLAACGGGSSKKTSDAGADGGMAAVQPATDLKMVNDQLSKLSGRADGLDKSVNDLTTKAKDIGTSVDALTARVKTLETPPAPVSCSLTESCIPNGIDLASTAIVDLVKKACSFEIGCCNADELALKFGPAIKTVDDCVMTFTDLVNNGFTPSFLTENAPLVNTVIKIAQAFNNPDVKIEIDAAQVKTCLADLDKRECRKYVAPDAVTTQVHCQTVKASATDDPCSPTKLINGLQAVGELCGVYPQIPECMDGLVCRDVVGSNNGLCASPSTAGDHCTSDAECDQGLFCNFAMGKCQTLAAAGDPCAYIDPTFQSNLSTIRPGSQGGLNQGQALSIKCVPGLSCDPKSKKCVDNCNDGSLCMANQSMPAYDCPDGLICNLTESPGLFTTWNMGVCRSPTKVGDPCTDQRYGSECASGRCGLNTAGDVVCQDALKKPGDACSTPGTDVLCSSRYCGTDSKCTGECKYDSTVSASGCASGTYCDSGEYTPSGGYACEPLIANSTACRVPVSGVNHDTCASGFCNGSQCAARNASAGLACPSSSDQQCQTTEYCNTNGTATCMTIVAKDGSCAAAGQGSRACGKGSYCYNNATCLPLGAEGDSCAGTPAMTCDPSLTCTSDNKCHAAGKYPDGVNCGGNHASCVSLWCSGNGATVPAWACKTPIAAGDDCDSVDTTKNRCADTSYCKFAAGEHAGKCTPKGSAGQACETRFGGADCLNHVSPPTVHPPNPGTCTLQSDAFVCDLNATASDHLICDGN